MVDIEVPEPGTDDVRISVEACGICHSDVFVKEGQYLGIEYPGCQARRSPVASTASANMTAPAHALAAVPDDLDSTAAAPLLCAGITTYNALRNSDARPGDLVAVQDVGGLGYLGIQYAHAAGFEMVAVSPLTPAGGVRSRRH